MKREFFVDTKRKTKNEQLLSRTRSRSWKKKVKHGKNGGKNKNRKLHKPKKAKNFGKVLFPTNNFLVGNYGLRRAERWDNMPSMPSEVGEIN